MCSLTDFIGFQQHYLLVALLMCFSDKNFAQCTVSHKFDMGCPLLPSFKGWFPPPIAPNVEKSWHIKLLNVSCPPDDTVSCLYRCPCADFNVCRPCSCPRTLLSSQPELQRRTQRSLSTPLCWQLQRLAQACHLFHEALTNTLFPVWMCRLFVFPQRFSRIMFISLLDFRPHRDRLSHLFSYFHIAGTHPSLLN